MSMFEVEKPDKIIIYSVGVWNPESVQTGTFMFLD